MNEGEDALPDLAPDSDDEDHEASCPRFPCAATLPGGHREKCTKQGVYNACVARPVRPAELKTNEPARAAMQDEWDRLRRVQRPDGKFGVWDESSVRE